MINTERPNTVAGLVAKRAELVKLRDQLEAEARNVTVDTSSPQDGAADHLLRRRKRGRLGRLELLPTWGCLLNRGIMSVTFSDIVAAYSGVNRIVSGGVTT